MRTVTFFWEDSAFRRLVVQKYSFVQSLPTKPMSWMLRFQPLRRSLRQKPTEISSVSIKLSERTRWRVCGVSLKRGTIWMLLMVLGLRRCIMPLALTTLKRCPCCWIAARTSTIRVNSFSRLYTWLFGELFLLVPQFWSLFLKRCTVSFQILERRSKSISNRFWHLPVKQGGAFTKLTL